jgi:hypothetical protein
MANLKISQLTATTQNTIGSWVVINNSGETTSNKSQLEYVLGLTKGSGDFSMKSADFLTDIPSIASSNYTIVLGNAASATTAPSQVIIGNGAYGRSENLIAIGTNAHDQGTGRDDGIAIGTNAEALQARSIAIGKDAAAVTDSIALGTDSQAIATSSICIGESTVVAGNNGVGIGYDIFQDRDNATVIGASSYVSGADSTVVGAISTLGQTGGDSERSTIVGVSNDIIGPGDDMIAIGYNNTLNATGGIAIGSDCTIAGQYAIGIGDDADIRSSDAYSILIGGSGNTYAGVSTGLGLGNIRIGGFDNTTDFTPGAFNTFIGGKNNTINPGGGGGQNNVFLGMSGRTITTITNNTTFVENLQVFGGIRQSFTSFSTSGSVVVDVSTVGYVEVVTTAGQTYDIQVSPSPNTIGDTVTFFIEYQSGATVNFNQVGVTTFRFNPDFGTPVFSAATTSRSILVFNTWDGNDMWEVSRSMNMI